MKAIIFVQQSAAQSALDYCTQNIQVGTVSYEGDGPFLNADLNKPYSIIIKHPNDEKWALVADAKVEEMLATPAVELDESWFPRTALN